MAWVLLEKSTKEGGAEQERSIFQECSSESYKSGEKQWMRRRMEFKSQSRRIIFHEKDFWDQRLMTMRLAECTSTFTHSCFSPQKLGLRI